MIFEMFKKAVILTGNSITGHHHFVFENDCIVLRLPHVETY